ncbi:uncharacterized protein [Typha angustifolia]|uniref:uncharacterized protein n=1 Tax=Typha angustifolia TaxID=59011 RepID=UPI003C2EF90B
MGGGRRRTSLPLDPDVVDASIETLTTSSSPSSSAESQSSDDSSLAVEELRRSGVYFDVLNSYALSAARACSLQDTKDLIRRYKPGTWIEEVGRAKVDDYEIPETTTLLLIGPRGSGKSTLVNKITRIFDNDPFRPDRAQVSHNLSATTGSCFLQEYMIMRNSKSLCIYDTRSLSEIPSDNFKQLQCWMTQGVRHGKMVFWDSDNAVMRKKIKSRERQGQCRPFQKRNVNFVIFVVDGTSILKSMDRKDPRYIYFLAETFNYPFMSFRDNKPVVVVTHGEELSLPERAQVRTHLGEILGIPPTKQIFDIPSDVS